MKERRLIAQVDASIGAAHKFRLRAARAEAQVGRLRLALEDVRRIIQTDPTNLPLKMLVSDVSARCTAALGELRNDTIKKLQGGQNT